MISVLRARILLSCSLVEPTNIDFDMRPVEMIAATPLTAPPSPCRIALHPPFRERGLALINVLLMVALASALVAAILVMEDAGIHRSLRLHEAASADAGLDGAELSAIAALRRDALRQPDSDDLNESWARIGDEDRKIAGGTFSLVVSEAQAKCYMNTVERGDVASHATLVSFVAMLHLDRDVGDRIAKLLAVKGPITSLAQLSFVGIDRRQIGALARFCTILPPTVTKINVNTADEQLLGALVGNPAAGRLIAAQRARRGFLTAGDFIGARTIAPNGTAFSSDYYWARGRITNGDTARELTTLLRRSRQLNKPEVVAVSRWIGGTAPLDAPPSPARS